VEQPSLFDPPARRRRKRKVDVAKQIHTSAASVHQKITHKRKPSMSFPVRSLRNVKYTPAKGFFELKGNQKVRTLTVNTVKTFAQTLKMMELSRELIARDDIATKRDAYYVSKNWGDARFNEQVESDTVMDDIEAMFMVNREQMRFIPEEKGGEVAGQLTVIDRDSDTGKRLPIDCTKFGSGAYSIPISVEDLEFETKAKFILAIETSGMFQRLVKHNYWRKANCILIAMGGVPTRACRRFIRRLSEARKIPVYAFVDCDPYGITNIYRTLKVGSGNAAHINEYFCVPEVRYLGITPDDIEKYKLPGHPLKDVDIKRARDALKNDPFILHHKAWQKALKTLVAKKIRVEQQALAARGLNAVWEEYLPAKLKHPERFLP